MKGTIAGAMLFALCACGGSDPATSASSGDPTVSTAAPRSTEVTATGATATGATATGNAAGSATNVPKAVCAFLGKEVPRLKARGSSVGALAGFAVDYAGWIEKDPNRKLKDAAELDAISTSTCPKVRSEILKVLDASSFTTVLG